MEQNTIRFDLIPLNAPDLAPSDYHRFRCFQRLRDNFFLLIVKRLMTVRSVRLFIISYTTTPLLGEVASVTIPGTDMRVYSTRGSMLKFFLGFFFARNCSSYCSSLQPYVRARVHPFYTRTAPSFLSEYMQLFIRCPISGDIIVGTRSHPSIGVVIISSYSFSPPHLVEMAVKAQRTPGEQSVVGTEEVQWWTRLCEQAYPDSTTQIPFISTAGLS